jgi:hypothetical protein
METNVLLGLIKDDIKLLDEISNSFISAENLPADEIEIALARAKSLAAEFEMLRGIVVREQEVIIKSDNSSNAAAEEEIVITDDVAVVQETDSELIDLEEAEVEIPSAGAAIQEAKAVEPLPDGGAVINEKPERTANTDKPARDAVQGALFDNEENNYTKIHSGTLDGKGQMIPGFVAGQRREIKFEEIPLKSMQEGIGINDRYLFIRELFGNEPDKFDETIGILDGLTEIEEAVGYLKQNFRWSKSEAGQKFLNLVKRRFRK